MSEPHWMERAACRTAGAPLFFQQSTDAEAAHVCLAHCKVFRECDTYAQHHTWHSAVVAGTAYDNRGKPRHLKAEDVRLCTPTCWSVRVAEVGT